VSDPWEVARRLADVVRLREVQRQATDKAAKRAIAANAVAYQAVVEAVGFYRTLTTALIDNAGVDKGMKLDAALTVAEAWLADLDGPRADVVGDVEAELADGGDRQPPA
jgi:hypothetical protein